MPVCITAHRKTAINHFVSGVGPLDDLARATEQIRCCEIPRREKKRQLYKFATLAFAFAFAFAFDFEFAFDFAFDFAAHLLAGSS